MYILLHFLQGIAYMHPEHDSSLGVGEGFFINSLIVFEVHVIMRRLGSLKLLLIGTDKELVATLM